jgi:O-antigen ligase
VGITTINSRQRLYALSWVILASEGYLALEFNRDYLLSGFNRVQELGFADLDNNGVAITMVGCAGLAFFLGLQETRTWRRWLAFALAAAMTHVVLLSNSRGGMLGLIVAGMASFLLIRKQPSHYMYFFIALLIGIRLAGPPVVERFSTIFAGAEERDASAESRIGLSATCFEMMRGNPLTGIGPGHFRLLSYQYGWPKGKDGHTTWLQVGAEMGVPAMIFLLTFYLMTMARCWNLARSKVLSIAPLGDVGRMAIASLTGYMVAAQFVTMYGVELSYYIALLGAGAVKLADAELSVAAVDRPGENELDPVLAMSWSHNT